jgi:Protein of unknown function (DUF1045)
MTGQSRYAIYYAPSPDTPLWQFGSSVLGYDAATGLDIPGFSLHGHTAAQWAELTKRPRTYGFHATLKAPFHLAAGDDAQLRQHLARFCAARTPFRLGPLAVTAIQDQPGHGFVALTPAKFSPELIALERDVVVGFDPFRRAMTEDERHKRKPDTLSPRQRTYLDTYGYPFVLEEFRFHMTPTRMLLPTCWLKQWPTASAPPISWLMRWRCFVRKARTSGSGSLTGSRSGGEGIYGSTRCNGSEDKARFAWYRIQDLCKIKC